MANGLHVDPTTGISANDRYAMNQEGLTTNSSGAIVTKTGATPTAVTLAQAQKAETDISHIDCDTIPFMWRWAKNFVLFDDFHQTIVGPSTPNAIAIIAGQSGETQWALHPDEGVATTYANPSFPNPLGATYGSNVTPSLSNAYVPIVSDPGPFPGSNLDTNAVKPPYNFDENPANPTLNLTFATQPLSFMGSDIDAIIKSDPNPTADLRDVQDDIRKVASFNRPVKWGWYQQGFNANDAPDPYEPPGSATTPTYHTVRQQRLCAASQRAAIFRLSRRQSEGAERQPARRQGLLRRRRRPEAAVGRRRVLSARRLRQQRRARAGGSDPRDPATCSSATTITRPTRTSRSPRPSRRGRSTTSPTARIGRRAPSSSPMMRRTASTITSRRPSAARSATVRSLRRGRAFRRS